jgi:lambda repressor-like predicted transcriptional regulator
MTTESTAPPAGAAIKKRIWQHRKAVRALAGNDVLDPRQRRAAIMSLLRGDGIDVQTLADEIGVTRQAVSQVLHGRERSERVETTLSEMLGLRPRVLFPEYYT